jgi:hypothetical protein
MKKKHNKLFSQLSTPVVAGVVFADFLNYKTSATTDMAEQ